VWDGARIAFGTLADVPELAPGAGGPVVILLGEVYREHAVVPAQKHTLLPAHTEHAVIPAKAGIPFA